MGKRGAPSPPSLPRCLLPPASLLITTRAHVQFCARARGARRHNSEPLAQLLQLLLAQALTSLCAKRMSTFARANLSAGGNYSGPPCRARPRRVAAIDLQANPTDARARHPGRGSCRPRASPVRDAPPSGRVAGLTPGGRMSRTHAWVFAEVKSPKYRTQAQSPPTQSRPPADPRSQPKQEPHERECPHRQRHTETGSAASSSRAPHRSSAR